MVLHTVEADVREKERNWVRAEDCTEDVRVLRENKELPGEVDLQAYDRKSARERS